MVGTLSQEGVRLAFAADGGRRPVAAVDEVLVRLRQQLGADSFQQRLAVGVGEVGAADGTGEQRVAGEDVVPDLQGNTTRAMTRCVQHVESKRAGTKCLAPDKAYYVLCRVQRRSELPAYRLAFGDEFSFCIVHRDGDRSERRKEGLQAADVTEVGVRQQNRFDIGLPVADQIDHELRLEVGVDHDCVVSLFILDQVRVGAELPVGGRLDANAHRSLRTKAWSPVSRTTSKPARRYMLRGPR